MIDYNSNPKTVIFSEFDEKNKKFWFDFKQRKFLANIDTFYYSVKFVNDFTDDSVDPSVISLRIDFENLKRKLNYKLGIDSIEFSAEGVRNLLLCCGSYKVLYTIRLCSTDEFDIFIAPVVPHGSSGVSVTPEIIVQLRSYFIWMYGINEAFERSFEFIKAISKKYGLTIDFVQENRCDYCWHNNYFLKPSSFFNAENFYKMRVSRYSDAFHHTYAVGSECYDVDFLCLGKRGSKCFVRIYNKTKEVIDMGYKGSKGFFFKIWFFNGLINRYDLYCYEEAYKKHNFKYLTIARLKWYLDNGSDPELKNQCQYAIDQYDLYGLVGDDLLALADKCTLKLNTIINVEFQTMRKCSKSFCLIPFNHVRNFELHPESCRIYDYLDNRAVICEYLTRQVLRLVDGNDKNKSRRPYCPFWAALRSAKFFDVKKNKHNMKLVREYNRRLNEDMARKKAINSIVRLGFYSKGSNEDSIALDLVDFINTLNDNDFMDAKRYKQKQLLTLSDDFNNFESKHLSSGFGLFTSDGDIIDRDHADELLNNQTLDQYFNEDPNDEY